MFPPARLLTWLNHLTPVLSQEAMKPHRCSHSACRAVNTAPHQEQQVLSLPIINYPECMTLGPLTSQLQISIWSTISLSSRHLFPFSITTLKVAGLKCLALLQSYFLSQISNHLSPYFTQSYIPDPIHLVPDASQSVSTATLGFSQVIPYHTDSLAPFSSLLEYVPSSASLHILMAFPLL